MEFIETPLPGVFVVKGEKAADERGFFARIYCRKSFAGHGIDFAPQQNSLSHNIKAGTLRGMHFQRGDAAEQKLVTCLRGKIYDVAVDLRKDSPSYKKWFGVELDAETGHGLYIPKGVAHGFITLSENADVLYQIDGVYNPAAASGVRWDDSAFGINWPREPVVISDRDKNWPDFKG
jgi:dTDP-4-dehydrorhamnose 3,5-epimerase